MINNGSVAQNPFLALLEAAVDAIIVIDDRSVIQVVNAAVMRLFDYEKHQLIGSNVTILMPSRFAEHHDDYVQHYLETGERKIIGIGRETVGQKSDGTCIPIYISVGEVVTQEGSRFVGIIRDLTMERRKEEERARAETEIRQLRERIIQVSRFSVLGEMARGIAHEVNQPLTAITTYAQGCRRMINTGLDDPTQLLEALEKIGHQAERSAKVIARIRDFSKKSPTLHERCDCNDMITEVVALAEVHAAELLCTIDLKLEQASEMVVLVDAIEVQQVLMNLINNAMESMAVVEGDRIVTIRSRILDPKTVEVAVSDLGAGLDDGVGEEVFDAFFTTKKNGLGIGLSICKSLVSAQGGRIYFHRNSDIGTTFSFTLPIAAGE